MLFYDQIDKKQTVKKAKSILSEYSRFLKILDNAYYDMNIQSKTGLTASFSSYYVNADAVLIDNIARKDRNYEELESYIKEIQQTINKLQLHQIELINLRFVDCLTLDQIEKRYFNKGKVLSERQLRRNLNSCCIDFAIAYGIYVKKGDKANV